MDKKAKKILMQTYWKNGGWIDHKERTTKKEDFLYAKEQGVMFDPLTISHDECIAQIIILAQAITEDSVVSAFLSSLSSRRLDLRSGIVSLFLAKKIMQHSYEPKVSGHFYENGVISSTHYTCAICSKWNNTLGANEYYNNKDLNVLNFERIKWGGVRFGDLVYTLFDLQQFQKECVPEPIETDISIFKEMLKTIESSQPDEYPSALRERFSKIELLKTNKSERSVLVEILACLGVLQPLSYDRPIRGKNDWHFAEYWRGEDKYDVKNIQRLFGKYL